LHIPRNRWGCFVEIKDNIPAVLAQELPKKHPGVVGISTVTDAYQPLEHIHQLTRTCLQLLAEYDFPVCVQTKSKLVLRDLDLMTCFSHAELMLSIGTLHDEERMLLEPGASSIKDRLNVLKEAGQRGLKTSVFFGPAYPTVSKEDLYQFLETLRLYNVAEIMVDRLNKKPGVIDAIAQRTGNQGLSHLFSQTQTYDQHYQRIHENLYELAQHQGIAIRDAFD